jgi:hypothetical protein
MKSVLVVVIAVTSLLLLGSSSNESEPTKPDFTGWPTYEVVEVVSPLYFKVTDGNGEYLIRFLGLSDSGLSSAEIELCNAYLNDTFVGIKVYLESDHGDYLTKDQDGVQLAYVYDAEADLFINPVLLQYGLLKHLDEFIENEARLSSLEEAETYAKQLRKGVWKSKSSISYSKEDLQKLNVTQGVSVINSEESSDNTTSDETKEEEDSSVIEPKLRDVRIQFNADTGIVKYNAEFVGEMGSGPYDYVLYFFDRKGESIFVREGSISFSSSANVEVDGWFEAVSKPKDYKVRWENLSDS